MGGTVHVVGAGVAGLACAVRLVEAGRRVVVHEAAGQAGGRCRSFHDVTLDRRIDNGNHLMLSGNGSIAAFLATIGAQGELAGPDRSEFPFLDLKSSERWCVQPNSGPLPWWILAPSRRVAGTTAGDYLEGLKLLRAGPEDTVAGVLDTEKPGYARFWEPLAVGVLNTSAEDGAAALLAPVLRETFAKGEAACRPRTARVGLSETFVDPAIAWLEGKGAEVRLSRRLKELVLGLADEDRVWGLRFGEDEEIINEGEAVVLAVPPTAAAELVEDLVVPTESRAIVNAHFRLVEKREGVSLLGLVGGTAQWIFVRGDVASVTVSAAADLAAESAEVIAERIWPEVVRALDLGAAQLPPYRIIKEKRATFAETPEQAKRRPGAVTARPNLFLAGDWTATGLPATIEGAVRSGHHAAEALLTRLPGA